MIQITKHINSLKLKIKVETKKIQTETSSILIMIHKNTEKKNINKKDIILRFIYYIYINKYILFLFFL